MQNKIESNGNFFKFFELSEFIRICYLRMSIPVSIFSQVIVVVVVVVAAVTVVVVVVVLLQNLIHYILTK